MDFALLLLALLGHGVLWIAMGNRIHATALPRWATRSLSVLCVGCLMVVPAGFGWWSMRTDFSFFGRFGWLRLPPLGVLYLGCCWVAAAVAVGWWARRGLSRRPPAVLRFHRSQSVELGRDSAELGLHEYARHFLVRLPGNEILKLDMTERAIDIPRLPLALDGLSIVHVSDFHFTGRVGKAYFQQVVHRSNQREPDLVAITGDLVDRPEYIDWVPDTLGRLRGRYGVYFVLGNHDLRADTDRLRRVLVDSGLVDLGGRWIGLQVRGEPVVLAGNELPWMAPAADMTRCPERRGAGGPLRIVLTHSPDQLDWAQAQDVDLLLAGHTHGGQIRLPLIGPVLSPTRVGVRYASGVFYAPPTVMHVTRGVSGQFPVRLKCPPEMAYLLLHAINHR